MGLKQFFDLPRIFIEISVIITFMANFNRGRGSGGGRNFNKPRFNDRGSRGPVEMHKAICDNCGKECEVPFRPTSGKPIFCSSCFENKGSDSRRFEGRDSGRSTSFEDRPMFEAICDDCGNTCKVPFQPRGDKPIYCSNCFGDKKGAGGDGRRESQASQPQNSKQLDELNSKLDRILQLLDPGNVTSVVEEEVIVVEEKPAEQIIEGELEEVPAKKKSPKKK